MSDSIAVKKAILKAHVGKDVTVVFKSKGDSSVFSGVLQQENDAGVWYWCLTSKRGIVQQHGTPMPIPETKIFFATEDVAHIIVKQETAEEALEKIQEEQDGNKGSGLVGPSGSMLQ